jgi:hypothetical protein
MQRLVARSLTRVARSTRWRSRTLGIGSLLGSLALAACDGGSSTPVAVAVGTGTDSPIDTMVTVPGDGDSEFVSSVGAAGGSGRGDLATDSSTVGGGAGTGGSAATPSPPSANAGESDNGGGAARAISEADILQLSGDRLYALSRFNGLTIIDASNPAALRLEGTYSTAAEPFEMYIEDGIVFAMFNSWYSYECDDANVCTWQTSSRMQALDTRNPADVQLLSDTVIPGNIADSRRVGDVLYVATEQSNYCWGCDAQQNTTLTSFNVATPTSITTADQLRLPVTLSVNTYAGPRSISVTDQRIYISGQEYSGNGGALPGTVQVVDISDASGALVQGATFRIAGPIQSRWQMDEYDGIFRVVSQPGGWGSIQPPVVQTFRVNSSSDIQPAASLPIVLPRPNEVLQSVRFDGTRAYAITAERQDPLFTFDLSDPDQPRQMGELEMPGFIYHMEPRGNLVYALGFDAENPDGAINVSLFDVTDLATPALLSRVAFGGDWANFAEGQNQIHKAFTILADQSLILVPFSGGSYAQDNNCEYEYGSGIQLVDIGQNTLTRRGVAPQVGNARRAFMHRDRLFGVGDNTVQTFDITDRDAPVATDKLDVARNVGTVRVMDDHLLRFGNDWSTNQTILDMTPLAKANQAQPDAEIDLSALFGDDAWSCAGGAYWGGQVFTRGDYAYVPRYSYTYDQNYQNYQQKLSFYIVDLSDRSAPRAVGSFTAALSNGYGGGEIVQTEDALLIARSEGQYQYSQINGQLLSSPRFYYDVYELSDPTAPTLASTFQVPELISGGGWGRFIGGCSMDMGWGWYGGYGYSSGNVALSSGDLVVSQHSEPVPGSDYQVKYYLDRIDVSDPYAPVMLPKVNIPGTAVHFNAGTGELVTVDYTLHREAGGNGEDCYNRGYYGEYIQSTRECNVMRRSINSLVVSGNRAVRQSQLQLDLSRRTTNIAVSDSRIFYTTGDFPTYYGGPVTDSISVGGGQTSSSDQTPISVITLESLQLDNGSLTRLPSVDLRRQPQYYNYGTLLARDERAFSVYDQTVTVVDTEQPMTPRRLTHEIPGWGCNSLEVGGDTAYCAVGQRGVEVIDLSLVK